MDRLTQFENLANRARSEPSPKSNVSQRVLAAVRSRCEEPTARFRREWTMTAVAATAAIVVALLALSYASSSPASADPWNEMFEPLSMVMR